MKVQINPHCPELEHVESPPCPQLRMDLDSYDYRRHQMTWEEWELAVAMYWAALISNVLKNGRN